MIDYPWTPYAATFAVLPLAWAAIPAACWIAWADAWGLA